MFDVDSLSHSEINAPQESEATEKSDTRFIPTIEALKSKLQEIFAADPADDACANEGLSGTDRFEKDSSGSITLNDGTVVDLPDAERYEDDNGEANIEENDPVAEKIAKKMSTPEGIKELMENHPEKAELWGNQLEALETLNDPDASPVEIRSAQAKLSILKGQIMEVTAKDALMNVGFDVEAQQRVVEGESGGTRPDVIAVNNTDQPIEVFGVSIQPEETLSIECKCGGTSYMTNQLNTHIPNQLSGQEGTKVLLTTSDIKGAPDGLATSVCNRYDANLVALDVSVYSVEKAIKEVAGE